MRPGPRLVVMVALAFILGAQSSTDQQQSQNNLQISNNINGNSNNGKGKLLSKRDESARENEASSAATAAAALFFDSILSKVNPWLSACDLAQPKAAPDLQVRPYDLSHLTFSFFMWNQHQISDLRLWKGWKYRNILLSCFSTRLNENSSRFSHSSPPPSSPITSCYHESLQSSFLFIWLSKCRNTLSSWDTFRW